jgi:hypothetical protein
VILQLGSGFTVSVLLQELVQLAALVTVTLYTPAAVRLLIVAVVAPVDHKYVPPPVAVKLVEPPAQIVLLPVILQLGAAFTINSLLHAVVHPVTFVTVTLYVPAAVRLQICALVAPVDHL